MIIVFILAVVYLVTYSLFMFVMDSGKLASNFALCACLIVMIGFFRDLMKRRNPELSEDLKPKGIMDSYTPNESDLSDVPEVNRIQYNPDLKEELQRKLVGELKEELKKEE